jgi:hypothetical protein
VACGYLKSSHGDLLGQVEWHGKAVLWFSSADLPLVDLEARPLIMSVVRQWN